MLIYLASPYTDKRITVENQRAKVVTIVAGNLIKLGYHIFCPIAHCHEMNRLCGLGGKFEYWREFDEKMISACGELWIVTIEGWFNSVGITAEIQMAERRSMTTRYVYPTTLDITREPMNDPVPLRTVLDYWKRKAA